MELHTPCKLLLLETTALDVACLAKASTTLACFPAARRPPTMFATYLRIKQSTYYPPIYLASCLSIDLSTYFSIPLSICLLFFVTYAVDLPEVLLVADLSMCYLSISLSLYLSIALPTYLTVCLPISRSFCGLDDLHTLCRLLCCWIWLIYPWICLSTIYHLSTLPSIYISVCLSIYLFVYLSIYLSIHPSIYLHIYLSTFSPSIYENLFTSIRCLSCPQHASHSTSGFSLCLHIIHVPTFPLSVVLFSLSFYCPSAYEPIGASKLISLSIILSLSTRLAA